MSMPIDLKRRIEGDISLIEAGEETYRSLAKRYKGYQGYNVKETDIYRIHQEKLERMKVEEAKDKLEALEEKKEKLNQEINGLVREKREIKAAFENQGLNWEQGVQRLKEVTDLGAILERLKAEEAATKGKLDATRRQIFNLERQKVVLQGEVSELNRIYHENMRRYQAEVPRLVDRESALQRSIYRLEKKDEGLNGRVRTLEERVEGLNGQEEEAKRRISKLRSEEEVWNRTIQNLKNQYEEEKERLQKESEKLVANCKQTIAESRELVEKIVKDAEQKKEILLGEVEELKKEKGILEAELKLIGAKLEEDTEKLRKKPRQVSIRLSPEDFSALKKLAPNGDVEALVREQITFVARHANGYGD